MTTVRDAQGKLTTADTNTTGKTPPSIEEILRGTAHAMTIFTAEEKAALDTGIFLKRDKPYLKCYATGKDRPAKPEEIVRQLYLKKLMDRYGYPVERIAVEKPVQFGVSIHEKGSSPEVSVNSSKTGSSPTAP